jgi:hypothetical protein|nr:MAG TPA: hypothetical protein [Caudoviricetes sp.]
MSCKCNDGDICVEMIDGRKKRIITLVELDSDKIREHDDFFARSCNAIGIPRHPTLIKLDLDKLDSRED